MQNGSHPWISKAAAELFEDAEGAQSKKAQVMPTEQTRLEPENPLEAVMLASTDVARLVAIMRQDIGQFGAREHDETHALSPQQPGTVGWYV